MATVNALAPNAAPETFMKKLTDMKAEASRVIVAAIPTKASVTRAAGYTAATFEYIGFASKGLFKSCEVDFKRLLPTAREKLDECNVGPKSIARAYNRLYKENCDRLKQRLREVAILRKSVCNKADLERINALEERLVRIEERLMHIERHGVTIEAAGHRKLGAEKLGLLRQLVEINKELRED